LCARCVCRGTAVVVCHAIAWDDADPLIVESVRYIYLGTCRIAGIFCDELRIGLISDVIEPDRVRCTAGRAFVSTFFGSDEEQVAGFAVSLAEDWE